MPASTSPAQTSWQATFRPIAFSPCVVLSSRKQADLDAEAERIYALLADGGEVYMPIQETFFASRFAQLRDRFGTSWMIIHEKPMGPPQGS